MMNTDFLLLGQGCQAVGLLLLVSALATQRPRRAIEEFFDEGRRSLRGIVERAVRKARGWSGFAFLLLGSGTQMAGLAGAGGARTAPSGEVAWILGALFLFGVGVGKLCTLYTRRSFRRYLSDYFRLHPWPLEQHIEVTKEIGEILRIPHTEEDTVEFYAGKVRRALGLPEVAPPPSGARERFGIPGHVRSGAVGF